MIEFIERAIDFAMRNVQTGMGGPFAALVVHEGQVIAEAANTVANSNDPTAHAEVNAIRLACATLKSFQLAGCDLYASCEPCPMCAGAIFWARLSRVFYAGTRAEAAAAGFDDGMIYKELQKDPASRSIPMIALHHAEAAAPFRAWLKSSIRRAY